MPALMHDVQALTRLGVPLTSARTRWMFGSHRRLFRLCENVTDLPNQGFFPHTSHTAAIGGRGYQTGSGGDLRETLVQCRLSQWAEDLRQQDPVPVVEERVGLALQPESGADVSRWVEQAGVRDRVPADESDCAIPRVLHVHS